jgi:hypothetical protein
MFFGVNQCAIPQNLAQQHWLLTVARRRARTRAMIELVKSGVCSQTDVQLAPCPFCASDQVEIVPLPSAVVADQERVPTPSVPLGIFCRNCGVNVRPPTEYGRANVIAFWNKRANIGETPGVPDDDSDYRL